MIKKQQSGVGPLGSLVLLGLLGLLGLWVSGSLGLWVSGGAFHLVKNSENSSSGLNGKRFFGSPDWKIPRKSGTAQKVVPFSRLERPNGDLSSIYRISRLYTSSMPFAVFLSGQGSLGSVSKNGG